MISARCALAWLVPLLLLMSGCSTVSEWISPSHQDPPAELQDIDDPISVNTLWTIDVGAGSDDKRLNLVPAYVDGRLYAADAQGQVLALNAGNGRIIWSVEVDAPFSGGPGVGEGLVVLGTTDAEVIALSESDGSVKWRVNVSSEVLSTPAVARGKVIVRTIDGKVVGLDAATGKQVWGYERKIPILTLRGTGSPVLVDGQVLCGMAGGKLVSLNVDDGSLRWDVTISVPSGRTELERLADIDGDPLAIEGIIYVATYQGEIAALEESAGTLLWRRKFSSYSGMAADRYNVYASDAEGILWALDADNGSARWSQDALRNRQLSDVALVSGVLAVGDYEGYVHFLSPDDGSLIGRTRVGSDPITRGMLVADGTLYVMGDGGVLAALQLKQP